MAWKIIARPEGENRNDKNLCGIVVYLRPSEGYGGNDREVGRVAFERSNSLHPDVKFKDQLEIEIGKAKAALEKINELSGGAGELR